MPARKRFQIWAQFRSNPLLTHGLCYKTGLSEREVARWVFGGDVDPRWLPSRAKGLRLHPLSQSLRGLAVANPIVATQQAAATELRPPGGQIF